MTKAVALETGTADVASMPIRSPKRHWLVRSRAWISISLLAPFAIVGLLSPPVIQEQSTLDFGLDLLGWAIFAAGAGFRWWSTFYIGSRKYWDLVTEGPYSVTRNPLYFGTFLIALSIAFFMHSLTFGLGMLLVAPFYLMLTVSWEEACLRERYGQRFDSYCQKVPRFWPRLANFQSPELIEVNTRGLRSELTRAMRWMWVPMLAQAVSHLRDLPSWPTHFNFW